MKTGFLDLPKPTLAGLAALAGLLAFLVYDQSHWWEHREEYSFGYLAPVFALMVLYFRLDRIKALLWGDSAVGVSKRTGKPLATADPIAVPRWLQWPMRTGFAGAFAFGLMFIALGGLYRASQQSQIPATMLITLGFASVALSMPFWLSDDNGAGEKLDFNRRFTISMQFLFPALIWLISAPLLTLVEEWVSMFLLDKVTTVVFFIFELFGYAIVREANLLILPNGEVAGVEEACSGIRSLTACLFGGAFLAAVFLEKFWKKALLVFLALVFAFITNIGRGLFLTGWLYVKGSEDFEKVHDIAGYAVIGVTVLMLLGAQWVLEMKTEWDEDELEEFRDEAEEEADPA